MHPDLLELLALRDGTAGPEASAHVAACAACTAEVERLRSLALAMRDLPVEAPARDLWPVVAQRAGEERWRRRWLRTALAAACLFILVTLAAALRSGFDAWQEASLAREAQQLVARSQQLEDELRSQERGRVTSGRTAGAMMELEDQIAAIDARLAQVQRRGVPPRDVVELWRERVGVLGTLVELHAGPPTYAGL